MPGLLTWMGTTFPVGPVRISTGVVMMLLLYIAVAFILGKDRLGPARLRGGR
jgi:fructose transport system permease protein